MKETFVNNVQQLMTANENQRIKIGYLQSEKQKREEYLSGLKQSILLNKQTLIVINQQGPNIEAIDFSGKQNLYLINVNQSLYQENRQLNASLLMEQQLRVQDKAFYLQRINEFENRIGDLRKYLHDKEESFSTVVSRLKKYEQWSEKPLSQKVEDTQGTKKITAQILGKLMSEKNMFKSKFQQIFPDAHRYQVLKQTLQNKVNYSRLGNNLHQVQNNVKALSQRKHSNKELVDFQLKQNKKQKQPKAKEITNSSSSIKPSQVNKQLMRLLKKQKLNNQILESALHNAIQKNEELLKINQNMDLALTSIEKKMQKVIAQNNFYRLRFRQFNFGYGKKYCQNRVKDDGQEPGFLNLFRLSFQVKDEQNDEVSHKMYKSLVKQSLMQDVERVLKIPLRVCKVSQKCVRNELQQQKMNQMTTNDMSRLDQKLVQERIKQKQIENQQQQAFKTQKYDQKYIPIMIKSASQPRIITQWQDGQMEQQQQSEQIIVDQF